MVSWSDSDPDRMGHYADRVVPLLQDLKLKDPDLYKAIQEACTHIIEHPLRAQAQSTGIQVPRANEDGVIRGRGMLMRLPVVGHPPWKVFWTTVRPRIEAVFEYPTS